MDKEYDVTLNLTLTIKGPENMSEEEFVKRYMEKLDAMRPLNPIHFSTEEVDNDLF